MLDALPEYRVKARNAPASGENKMHDDAIARQYGFPGALVPGVLLYAYLTHPLAAGLGEPWLTRGTAHVRFLKPVLDGEEVTVAGAVTGRDAQGVTATVRVSTARAGECAVAEATVPAGLPTPVNLALYPVAPLPAERPPVSRKILERAGPLGTPEAVYDESRATAWLERVADPLPVYRGPGSRIHPAFFLDQANRSLDRNMRLEAWVHAASRVRHLGGAWLGEQLVTRGRVRSLYERKGREYVEVDLVLAAGARPVAHVLHTAIYRLPLASDP